jgi:Fe-Mn family superoxide dismutase
VPADVSRQTYPFSLPDLPYAYDALEPHIDSQTLRIHHREHHESYVKKLNAALAGDARLQRLTLAELLRDADRLPAELRAAVRNNGGGHLNHDLFWRSMAPAARAPRGALAEALARDFGSFAGFREKFSGIAAQHFASGWAALALAHASGKLIIADLEDHEILNAADSSALVMLDVWEHAYYLKYQNRRAEFIAAFWNVVDWTRAEEAFARSIADSAV